MLAACAPDQVIEHQTINYIFEPEVYQHCEDEPQPPREGATAGEWIANHEAVRAAGQDCRDKVNGGREWAERHKKPDQPAPPNPAWWDEFFGDKENPD